ncbi:MULTISPECIES: hypothetical protein [Streptomyces]|uniref:hypothetical protein n=1 Tax=Streptomyces TaxID=1883 RepID=UPI0029AE4F74|nr:hypothetical protein [Streptomyces scabiei]MDX3119654.1 hypothetical protein [Streptomyces scabiei]
MIGEREAGDGPAAVRLRDGRRPGALPVGEPVPLPVGEPVRRIGERAAVRGVRLWERGAPA